MPSHHFVGFTGDPGDVAHDLQLHVSLGVTRLQNQITDQLDAFVHATGEPQSKLRAMMAWFLHYIDVATDNKSIQPCRYNPKPSRFGLKSILKPITNQFSSSNSVITSR